MRQRDGPTRSVPKVFRKIGGAAAALDRDALGAAGLRQDCGTWPTISAMLLPHLRLLSTRPPESTTQTCTLRR
ncbi:MAG: hypothetical protein KF691_10430 [Phycisphaeraceae bacterium]|nr:hypothetical protein [Phycisphaeraceae bacterium]